MHLLLHYCFVVTIRGVLWPCRAMEKMDRCILYLWRISCRWRTTKTTPAWRDSLPPSPQLPMSLSNYSAPAFDELRPKLRCHTPGRARNESTMAAGTQEGASASYRATIFLLTFLHAFLLWTLFRFIKFLIKRNLPPRVIITFSVEPAAVWYPYHGTLNTKLIRRPECQIWHLWLTLISMSLSITHNSLFGEVEEKWKFAVSCVLWLTVSRAAFWCFSLLPLHQHGFLLLSWHDQNSTMCHTYFFRSSASPLTLSPVQGHLLSQESRRARE